MRGRRDAGRDHRVRHAAAWCVLAVAVAAVSSAQTAGTLTPAATVEDARYVMGTVAVVRVTAREQALAEQAAGAAQRVFARVDSLMSTWRDDSALSALNGAPAGAWAHVGGETARVLQQARDLSAATDGAFDPTVLPLVRLWGFRGGEPRTPRPADLAGALALVSWRDLEVDGAGGRARLGRAGMAVDLGGIAKGHALAAAADTLRARGVASATLDLGGNLYVMGASPGAAVTVVDPRDGTTALLDMPLLHPAVATSGQYERYVDIEGRRYGHILDPRDGLPVPGAVSVSVQAADAVAADALATAAVVLGAEAGFALLESRPGVEAVVVTVGEEGGVIIRSTSGLRRGP